MTLKEMYEKGCEDLDEAGVESPEVDAFYLMEYLTGLNRARYLLEKDRQVTEETARRYSALIERRAAREPYQYITGEADFLGYRIKVDENVLIPRFDTETVVMEAVGKIPENTADFAALDLCTGSGCIAIALKCLRPEIKVFACDISEKALALAEENAGINGADIEFFKGDLFDALPEDLKFDLIISNPPYVTEEEYEGLSPEVKDHEPILALTAGRDGLDIYRRLIPEGAKRLKSGGSLVLETGWQQGESVTALLKENGFEDVYIKQDLSGLDRMAAGTMP